MTNQKGFATILALCLLLVVTFVARGIQDSERNHIHETDNAVAEFELQNAADSALIAAVEKIYTDKIPLPEKKIYTESERKQNQLHLIATTVKSKILGDITVNVWCERIDIHKYKVVYNGEDDEDDEDSTTRNKARFVKYNNNPVRLVPSGNFFSLAEATNPQTGRKIYRRAHAYVPLADDDTIADPTICFMDTKQSDYDFDNS